MNQHLIQEEKEKLFDMFPVLKSVLEQTEYVSALKGSVTLMSMFEHSYESSLKRVYTSAKREVIEGVEKKIEKLYSGFEDNKPVVFASISEQHYNQGLYQGRLNAMEIVTQDLFGINGDELKSTISSLKESLPAKSEEK